VSSYADTSFLISLFTPDANSVEASEVFGGSTRPFLLTPFGEAEFVNTLELRVFRKELEAAEADAYFRAFHTDIDAGVFSRRMIPATAHEQAVLLSRRHTRRLGTRGMDVLHVAIAVELGAGVFITFDRGQRQLARAAGLTIRPGRRSAYAVSPRTKSS
jgi:predicted nucleic acid-binding protein